MRVHDHGGSRASLAGRLRIVESFSGRFDRHRPERPDFPAEPIIGSCDEDLQDIGTESLLRLPPATLLELGPPNQASGMAEAWWVNRWYVIEQIEWLHNPGTERPKVPCGPSVSTICPKLDKS